MLYLIYMVFTSDIDIYSRLHLHVELQSLRPFTMSPLEHSIPTLLWKVYVKLPTDILGDNVQMTCHALEEIPKNISLQDTSLRQSKHIKWIERWVRGM